MQPKEKLQSILNNEYKSEDGDSYKVVPFKGLSDSEISAFEKAMPNSYLPVEIKALLKFARGFDFSDLEEVEFDTYGYFGFDALFPNSIQLAGDGYGNFWILDIDSKGNWKEVYFVCHDPAVVVKQSENLSEFIGHVDEFGLRGAKSHLEIIHSKTVMDIWKNKVGIMESNETQYNFPPEIVAQLPASYLVADLTNKPLKTGFAWGKFGVNAKIIRVGDKPIWIIDNSNS